MSSMFMRAGETIIEQLSHEIAILKRYKFAKRSGQISPAQGSLLVQIRLLILFHSLG